MTRSWILRAFASNSVSGNAAADADCTASDISASELDKTLTEDPNIVFSNLYC